MSAMGEVLPYRSPQERTDNTAFLGMVLFLASWAMMFAALFLGYAVLRTRSAAWPPPGVPLLPKLWPTLNSVVIFASSVVLQAGVVWSRRGLRSRAWMALATAALLGALFLGLQVLLWKSLPLMGVTPSTGAYGSVFYGLTWFHALHVAVGVIGLGRVAWKIFAGELGPSRTLSVRLWAMYWHFVGIVWAILYVSVFWV